jgi:hypothetical protein
MGERAGLLALRALRSQKWACSQRAHGSPFGRQQVESLAVEFGCALPEMPFQSSMDSRLLPIYSLRHLPSLATGTRESLQCVGTRERAYAIRLGRLRRSKQMPKSSGLIYDVCSNESTPCLRRMTGAKREVLCFFYNDHGQR